MMIPWLRRCRPQIALSVVARGRHQHAVGVAATYTGSVKFRVVLEYDPVAQSYSAVCSELPGCASAGETEAEARQSIEGTIRLYITPSDFDLIEKAAR